MKNIKQEEKTIYLKVKIKRFKPFTIKATQCDMLGKTNTKGECTLVEILHQIVYVDRLKIDFSQKTISILEIIVFLALGASIAVFVWAATSLF